MKDKFLITGVCGFVAQYLIEFLNKNHKNLTILGIDLNENCCYEPENTTYKQVDLNDRALIKKTLSDFRPDYIINLASFSSVSRSWESPVESFNNNTNILLNLLESTRELKLKTRFLSIGSSEEYGDYSANEMPLKEEYFLKPNNPYSIARVSQEMLSKLYADSFGLDIVMTRSFNHIGPRQRNIFVVSSFAKQIVEISKNPKNNVIKVGNVGLIRDFLDVRDVVEAYYKIITKGKTGEIYNVCSGNGIELKKIITILSEILNIEVKIQTDKAKIRPADCNIIIGDNSKIKRELGWEPKYTLDCTLTDMLKYWEEELK